MRHFYLAFLVFVVLCAFGSQATPLDHAETVVLTSPAGGVRLNGILRMPSGPGPFPTVVLLPERGTDNTNPLAPENQLLSSLADYLVSQGIAVLNIHQRGHGGSGGSAATTTLAERSADAIAALNYLRARPQVDVTRLGLIGHGEGANVALLAGAQPLAPTFVVAVAAAGLPGRELLAHQPIMYGKVLGTDSTDSQRAHRYRREMAIAEKEAANLRAHGSNAAQVQTFLDQQRLRQKAAMRRDEDALFKHQRAMLEIVRQTPDNAQAQAILSNMMRQRYPSIAVADVQSTVQTLTTPAYRSYLAFDPLPELAKVQCPVLLMQGENDTDVNATANLPLLKKALRSNTNVTELRMPGLNHAMQLTSDETAGFEAPLSPDALTDIHNWVKGQK